MLQNLSLIVCIKKDTRCVVMFSMHNDLNGVLSVCVYVCVCVCVCVSNILIKLFMNNLI